MATEQEKFANRARMWGLTALGLTAGIWEMVEEASASMSLSIGEAILTQVEKQLGLELAGEKPEHMLVELCRIFVDEYGYCTETVIDNKDTVIKVTLKNAVGTIEFGTLQKDHGVEKIFSNPFMCVGIAGLARIGVKTRGKVEFDIPNKTQVITFEVVS